MEVSGFIRDGSKSPYPEARSQVGGFWRCGPHRARFIGQSVWDLKESFRSLGVDLCLRAGRYEDVLQGLLRGLEQKEQKVAAVWMTAEESVEEKRDERAVSSLCAQHGVDFNTWQDEKYFIDDRDTGLESPEDLPDVFTTYRKTQEPLRERPRASLPRPDKSALPPYPSDDMIAAQAKPFEMSTSEDDLIESLVKPVKDVLADAPGYPENAKSVHPFDGGESQATKRLNDLVKTGAMSRYKDTRNGLLGVDFSTKLSAYLAMGCLTARQIHEDLVRLENGTNKEFKDAEGFGQGENEGTKAVRFELLWRDYMRLCTRKFGYKLFRLSGFREDQKPKWKAPSGSSSDGVTKTLQRVLAGTTGMGLIDASQRELYHSGYTSNRARQNVASFITKHLGIDWRYGAEWYECLLVDYDVNSNWSNWQYVAGVGNDPRGEARIFNPVKQAFDYDKEGEYVKTWVPETRELEKLENVFQLWTTKKDELAKRGLLDNLMVKEPVKRIEFSVEGKPKGPRRPFMRRRPRGGGNQNGGPKQGGGKAGTPNNNTSQKPGDHGQQQQQVNGNDQNGRGGPNNRSNYRGGYRGRGGINNGYQGGRGGFGPNPSSGGYGGFSGTTGYTQVVVNGATGRPHWVPNPGVQM